MIISLNELRVRTVEQVREILEGTRALDFTLSADPFARCAWIASVLGRLHYRQMGRANRGVVLQYLRRFSGLSRAQVTRLVRRFLRREKLIRRRGAPSNTFARRYTDDDLDALAEVEREYGRLSGPATVVVLRRMRQVYDDERFERLQHLSASHLYNLRRSAG